MNSNMTRSTKYPKVFNFIVFMTFIYMMSVKSSFRFFTNKTFVWISSKCSFSINATSLSIVRIVNIRPFKRIKSYLLTLSAAKFRFSRFFANKFFITYFAHNNFFTRTSFAPFFKAFHRTKRSSFIFASRYIGWSKTKKFIAKFTNKINFLVSRFLVAFTRAKFSTIFFKRFLTSGTFFHMSNYSISHC